MQLLCPLTEWETTKAERGRATGNEITSRTVVALDNWNWCISTQRDKDDGNIVGFSFVGNICQLFRFFETHTGLGKIDDLIHKVITALNKVGTQEIKRKPLESPTAFGKRIDDAMGTSFLVEYPPKVLKKMFKNSEVDLGV